MKRKIPRQALEFRAEISIGGDDPLRGPVRIKARSGDPIDHWYWGKVVHDFEGMTHKPRIPLDWCHNQDEAIGYADRFDYDTGDLWIDGELVSINESDRAARTLHQGRGGIPHEASIKFSPHNLIIEDIPTDFLTEVNGRQVIGPAVVFRQWGLQGVAICLYGADSNTASEFKSNDEIEVDICERGDLMKKKTDLQEEPVVEEPVVEEPVVEDPVTTTTAGDMVEEEEDLKQDEPELVAQLRDYTARFGGELATQFVLKKTSISDAYVEFVASLKTRHETELTELQGKVTELQGKLTAIGQLNQGGPPVSATPEGEPESVYDERVTKFTERMPKGVARFAAGIKIPRVEQKK